MKLQHIASAAAIAALASTGFAAANPAQSPNTAQLVAAANTNHQHNGGGSNGANNGITGRNAGQMQRVSGVIVDYLAYVTRAGTRGPLYTGNTNGGGNNGGGNGGGGNGGNNVGTNGGGGAGGNNGGGNGGNGGGNNDGGTLRPLGILVNGKLYEIDLPAQHSGLANQIAQSMGRTVALMGHKFSRGGANVFVVDAIE